MNPVSCGRANSIWIRIRVDVEIFESAKKNLWIKKYPHTSGRGLKLRSHCHFDIVWERHSCDNGKEICQKVRCTFRLFFLLSLKPVACFFLFSCYLRRHGGCSSSPVGPIALPCRTTINMRRLRWKADDLMRKGRRKRRSQLLANREDCIWKQLNLLSCHACYNSY